MVDGMDEEALCEANELLYRYVEFLGIGKDPGCWHYTYFWLWF